MYRKSLVRPRCARTSKARITASLGAVILIMIGASCEGGVADPSAQVDEIFLEVYTQEYEPPRWLMTIGEIGRAHVLAFKDGVGVQPGRVTFGSSNPNMLQVGPSGLVDANLIALAVGEVDIEASVAGQHDVARVQVVAAPLPVDRLQVRLSPFSSEVDATYDTEGDLVSVRLPVGVSAALDVRVERGGRPVSLIPFVLASTAPATVRVDEHCRPPSLDAQCDVFSEWGWITGMAAGASTITLTVRNLSATFEVTVL